MTKYLFIYLLFKKSGIKKDFAGNSFSKGVRDPFDLFFILSAARDEKEIKWVEDPRGK